jgi:methionyl-tRNA synthetase
MQTETPRSASNIRRYITTSIPYVNAAPHVGFALEMVQADALARFYRVSGDDVRFQAGTDENSIKNVHAADLAGIPVAELVERNASRFLALKESLDLSFDDFIRTSADPRHRRGAERLWNACCG